MYLRDLLSLSLLEETAWKEEIAGCIKEFAIQIVMFWVTFRQWFIDRCKENTSRYAEAFLHYFKKKLEM